MEDIIKLYQQRSVELTKLIGIQNQQLERMKTYIQVQLVIFEHSDRWRWWTFVNCYFKKQDKVEAALDRLVKKQREEIKLLQEVVETQKEEYLKRRRRIEDAFIQLATLAAQDCCKDCCSINKKQKRQN